MRINKYLTIVVLALGCDQVVTISDDHDANMRLSFECGNILLRAKTMGARHFWIYLNCELRSEVSIKKSEINVLFKRDTIPFKISDGDNEVNGLVTVNGSKELRIYFELRSPDIPLMGDTIKLDLGRSLKCSDRSIDLRPIYFVMRREFR